MGGKWNPDTVRTELGHRGWLTQERAIEHGVQFTLTDGTKVSAFNSGKVVVQGKQTELRQTANSCFASQPPHASPSSAPTAARWS